MVKLIPVDPADVPTERSGRRGRVSYPIIKNFLEMNQKMCKLDLTGLDKNPAYLRSVLYSYIKSHNLPIKVFSADGELHLMRLDLDNEGNLIEGWEAKESTTDGHSGSLVDEIPVEITVNEVSKRYTKEKGATTK